MSTSVVSTHTKEIQLASIARDCMGDRFVYSLLAQQTGDGLNMRIRVTSGQEIAECGVGSDPEAAFTYFHAIVDGLVPPLTLGEIVEDLLYEACLKSTYGK